MKTRVRLFAILREKAGTGELALELPDGSTVAHAIEEIAQRFPALREGVSNIMVAVNTEYVHESQPLHDGDEVALIPPVSGGAWAETKGDAR